MEDVGIAIGHREAAGMHCRSLSGFPLKLLQ